VKIAVKRILWAASVLLIATPIGMGIAPVVKRACAEDATVSFSEDILPLLKWRCARCHQPPNGEGYVKSGVDLTSYTGLMKGTKFGRMVIPGDADLSNLMMLLDWRVSPEIRMPHEKKKLSICDRDTIRRWIWEGAKDN
jgi:hypothetical protein